MAGACFDTCSLIGDAEPLCRNKRGEITLHAYEANKPVHLYKLRTGLAAIVECFCNHW